MSNYLTVGLSTKEGIRDLRRSYLADLLRGYCVFLGIGYNHSDVGFVLRRDRTTVRHMVSSFISLHSGGSDKFLNDVYGNSASYFKGCYKNVRFDLVPSNYGLVDFVLGEDVCLSFVSPYVYCGLGERVRKRYVKRLNLRLN